MQGQRSTESARSTSTSSVPNSSSSQRSRILNFLIAVRGGEVGLPEISALAAQNNARLFELRRLGLKIVNRTEEREGVLHSWLRLVSSPAQAETSPTALRTNSADSQIRSAAATNSTRGDHGETFLFPGGNRP